MTVRVILSDLLTDAEVDAAFQRVAAGADPTVVQADLAAQTRAHLLEQLSSPEPVREAVSV